MLVLSLVGVIVLLIGLYQVTLTASQVGDCSVDPPPRPVEPWTPLIRPAPRFRGVYVYAGLAPLQWMSNLGRAPALAAADTEAKVGAGEVTMISRSAVACCWAARMMFYGQERTTSSALALAGRWEKTPFRIVRY